ncbi:MAG: hypothetical protein JWN39_1668 [Ilumatobacteraceae bacterium]|nr:hypothetical protein [Ilumatobacteraceae bacterium]
MARFRFAHVGVVLGLIAAGVTSMQLVEAAGSTGTASSLVPIAPCRLVDTRPDTLVGGRSAPLAPGEIVDFAVWGTNGNCAIPSTATGIATNVTAVGPTASGYLTVYPGDVPRPTTSNLNFVPTSPPTPNQVTVGLSATGGIKIYNFAGSVDVVVDIVGYYVPSPTGAGPQGIQGPPGVNATNPAHVITVGTSGGDFANPIAALNSITTNSATNHYLIRIAPGTYDTGTTGVVLKNFVDIEGSGQGTTVITCQCAGGASPATDGSTATLRAELPVVVASTTSEVRDLTVVNRGGGAGGVAIWAGNTAGTVSLRNVTATASGASNTNIGVFSDQAVLTLDGVTGQATGGTTTVGVYFFGSAASVSHDVTGSGSGGSSTNAGAAFLTTPLSISHLVATGSGGVSAFGVIMSAASPMLQDVTAMATGASDSRGLFLSNSSPTVAQLVATSVGSGSAGSASYGMYLDSSSNPTLTDAAATAGNAHTAFGAYVNASSPTWIGGTSTATATNIDGSTENASGIDLEGASGAADVREVVVRATSVAGTSSSGVLDGRAAGVSTLDGVRVTAAGPSSTGVLVNSSGAAQIVISSSQIAGGTSSITNNTGPSSRVLVSNSALSAIAPFVITCAFVANSTTGGTLNATCG